MISLQGLIVQLEMTDVLFPFQVHIKGSLPEWCISTIYHAWDTPFWSGTLDIVYVILQFHFSHIFSSLYSK